MKIRDLAHIGVCLLIAACAGGGGGGGDGSVREIAPGDTLSGAVARVGEVDWYHLRAVAANTVLQVRCASNTYRPDVDLSVAVYAEDDAGERARLHGDHAPDGGQLPADLEMNVYVERPQELYIAVRDLMDDEASDSPYYLSVAFAAGSDGNETFATARPLTIDDPADPTTDTIGSVGDVDCYRFATDTAGVYAVEVEFTPFDGGTEVALTIELYDQDGALLQSWVGPQRRHYRLLPYLEAGSYYALVKDFGRDDFDTASSYSIAVRAVASSETLGDDSALTAAAAGHDPVDNRYRAEGALEYAADEDWYRLELSQGSTVGLQVLELEFEDGDAGTGLGYELSLIDADGKTLLGHDFRAGAVPYRTQVLAGTGDHFLRVRCAAGQVVDVAAPYTAQVTVRDVDDPAELAPGNDTADTAIHLQPGGPTEDVWEEGVIAYRGDEDWYAVVTDTGAAQVLEMFLETERGTRVDYTLSVLRDGLLKKLDATGGEDPVLLRSSIFVPAALPSGPVTYLFRVADVQGDEGDGDMHYRIRCNSRPVPAALPADGDLDGPVSYLDEVGEQADAEGSTVRLEHTSLVQREYAVNTSLLRFNDAEPAAGISRTSADGLTTITFPWLRGYVDFQGDLDWYALDLGPLLEDGVVPDSAWYYDIQVELQVGDPGAAVEYVWKLYRDVNQNAILVDQPGDSDGFFASGGDPDTEATAFNQVVPGPGDDAFWVGDAWEGRFYLSVGDFNYVAAMEPDDDWGYDSAPYALRLTLTYHPGVSRP